jgi:ribosomal protein L29
LALDGTAEAGPLPSDLQDKFYELGIDFMKSDKIRNLTDAELQHQGQDLADQLFKLKFQLNMGQTESLKKIRGLRKDIARVKTILGERTRAAVTEKR